MEQFLLHTYATRKRRGRTSRSSDEAYEEVNGDRTVSTKGVEEKKQASEQCRCGVWVDDKDTKHSCQFKPAKTETTETGQADQPKPVNALREIPYSKVCPWCGTRMADEDFHRCAEVR